MKKFIFHTLAVLLLTSCGSTAQDMKVKGNREPTTEITIVKPFNTLEVDDDFKVKLVPGSQPEVELITDSNLHEHIEFNSIGSKLTINSTARIRSKRKMEFRITYSPDLHTIIVKDDAEVSTVTKGNFPILDLQVQDKASAYITATVQQLKLHTTGDSKSELNLTGNKANIQITDNADVKALITYQQANLFLRDRVDARIEGDVDRGKITITDKAFIEAKNLVYEELTVVAGNNSKAEVNAKKTLTIEADKDADISVFNKPDIILTKFEGEAVLRKK
ncbi:GIN domain-containing protein [Nonlabens spongiae]|nr:DUF2807 domain-containing protein [Nonlabens spongiae]